MTNAVCFSGGRTIIFPEKKESAYELAGLLPGAKNLHGDIQQSQCEVSYELIRFLNLCLMRCCSRVMVVNVQGEL
jgi:ATP-dependent RNA helicase DDX21